MFLHTLRVFRFHPYFYHDAFMHHTMHVLNAPPLLIVSYCSIASVRFFDPQTHFYVFTFIECL